MVSGMWLTEWIVEAARWVQTAGSGLPVAAVALNASTPVVAIASKAGARRSAGKARIDAD